MHDRQQDVAARIQVVARQVRRLGPLQQIAHAAEHVGVGGEHVVDLRLGQRSDVVEGDDGHVPAGCDVGEQLRIERQELLQSHRHARCLGCLLRQRVEHGDRALVARRREVFLLAVVVGHAVGDQADARRDVRERRALHAVLVEQERGGREHRLALLLEAVRLGAGG